MRTLLLVPLLVAALGAATIARAAHHAADNPPAGTNPAAWNPKAAATFLDERADWWAAQKFAARDHDTYCVACHSGVPFILGRAALRERLGEAGIAPSAKRLLENVTKRVRLWGEVEPYYKGEIKAVESRGTEAVLNALILAPENNADTRLAFTNMWAEQGKDGAFPWLQFKLQPWEAPDSIYYGATLAAVALGLTSPEYRDSAENAAGVQALKKYLQDQAGAQSLMLRATLLWAATKLPGLLTPAQQQDILTEALAAQAEDGGWSLGAVVGTWERRDKTPLETRSDGYATGVITLALVQSGARDHPQVKRALAWLVANQDPTEGHWVSWSLNKQRPATDRAARMMDDAATAYAVLALTGL